MEIKYRLYAGLRTVSLVVGLFGSILLGAGFSEPFVPSLLSAGQHVPAAVAVFVLGAIGVVGFGRLRKRRWYAIGREAGLTPDGGTDDGGLDVRVGLGRSIRGGPLPDLVGEVHGRPVTVGTYSVKSNSGGEGGSSKKTYTIVDTDLSAPTDIGAVLGAGEEPSDLDGGELLPGGMDAVAVDDRFLVVGNIGEPGARELLDGHARDAVLDLGDDASGLTIGDPTDAILSAVPDDMGMAASFVVGKVRESLQEHPSFDASTVGISSRGVLLDPTEMERRTAAVAAVADAVERQES